MSTETVPISGTATTNTVRRLDRIATLRARRTGRRESRSAVMAAALADWVDWADAHYGLPPLKDDPPRSPSIPLPAPAPTPASPRNTPAHEPPAVGHSEPEAVSASAALGESALRVAEAAPLPPLAAAPPAPPPAPAPPLTDAVPAWPPPEYAQPLEEVGRPSAEAARRLDEILGAEGDI